MVAEVLHSSFVCVVMCLPSLIGVSMNDCLAP